MSKAEKKRMFSRTGEVTALLDIEAHVLRYWETRFTKFVCPIRRADGRRLYRPEDVAALSAVKFLVRQNGYTIKAASNIMHTLGVEKILQNASEDAFDSVNLDLFNNASGGKSGKRDTFSDVSVPDTEILDEINDKLYETLNRLEEIKARIDGSKAVDTGRISGRMSVSGRMSGRIAA